MRIRKSNGDFIDQIQIILVLLGAPLLIGLDSPWFSQYYADGQSISNALMILFYSWIFLTAERRLHWLILIVTITSLFAEIIGSKILTVYQYRLGNIPLFIPLGHAVSYSIVYKISRQPLFWQHHQAIENFLHRFAFLVSFLSLVVLNDIAGFIVYIFFLMMLRHRKKPLFYLSMFAVVYYFEFLGTVLSAWSYYFVLGNHPHYPPTSVIPCGIGGVYMLLDISCDSLYFYGKKIKRYICKQARKNTLIATITSSNTDVPRLDRGIYATISLDQSRGQAAGRWP